MDFRLTPPDPKTTTLTFTSQLLSGIKNEHAANRGRREITTVMSFRLPSHLLEDFRKGCEKQNITQSAVLVGLLRAVVPVLQADPTPPPPTQPGAEELQHFVELLRMALPQVVSTSGPQTPGTR